MFIVQDVNNWQTHKARFVPVEIVIVGKFVLLLLVVFVTNWLV